MSEPIRPSALARAVTQFLTHKRTLGHRYRHEAWLLQTLRRHVEQGGCRELDAECFGRWLTSLKDRHPNTRHKWYQIVRHFCRYRRRGEPGCFLPPEDGAPKRQPYVIPVIVTPPEIARMLGIASKLPGTNRSPLRAPALRLAIVLLYTCGLRLGELLRLILGDVEEGGALLRGPEVLAKPCVGKVAMCGTRALALGLTVSKPEAAPIATDRPGFLTRRPSSAAPRIFLNAPRVQF